MQVEMKAMTYADVLRILGVAAGARAWRMSEPWTEVQADNGKLYNVIRNPTGYVVDIFEA